MKRNEEKTLKSAFRKFRVTDIPSFIRRDRASYRDARTHLKRGKKRKKRKKERTEERKKERKEERKPKEN